MLRLIEAYREGFRAWVRRHTKPISIEEAEEKRLFWSKMYALSSLSVLGLISYYVLASNVELPLRKDVPKNVAVGLQMSTRGETRFITFRGFQKVEDFTYSKEEMQRLAETKTEQNVVPEVDDFKAIS